MLFPAGIFGEGPPDVDLIAHGDEWGHASLRNQGGATNIAGRDGLIHLNTQYLLPLNRDWQFRLLKTVVHEGLHFTRPAALQVWPDFDHTYIKAQAEADAKAAFKSFKKLRDKLCKCPGK